jgi:maltooligosyltrehalose trehalohydrolase
VICAQNHDQIGNRRLGDRLSATLSLEQLKLAAGCVLLSPFIPMLFMGEEYGETAPFQYFVSHGDPALVKAVRQGRSKEFAAFKWKGELPDPQAVATFESCRLNRDLLKQPSHQALLEFHRELIRLRKSVPAIASAEKETIEVLDDPAQETLCVRYRHEPNEVVLWFYFGSQPTQILVPLPAGAWRTLLDSAAPQWQGPGRELLETLNSTGHITLTLAPTSVLLLQKI